MTALGLVREYFPDASDEEADGILWERTGFPGFFTGDPEACLRRQLAEYREALKLNLPLCDFCNEPRLTCSLCAACAATWSTIHVRGLLTA